jgi:hypothetical protein
MLGFYPSYLKVVLEMVSFSSQTSITFNNTLITAC